VIIYFFKCYSVPTEWSITCITCIYDVVLQ
jgi:hypothetical protein